MNVNTRRERGKVMERFTAKNASDMSVRFIDNKRLAEDYYAVNVAHIKTAARQGKFECEFQHGETAAITGMVIDMLEADGYVVADNDEENGSVEIKWDKPLFFDEFKIDVRLSEVHPGDIDGLPSVRERDVITIHQNTNDDGYPEPYMTINGKGGYGHGTWVIDGIDGNNREVIQFTCMFGVIVATDFQHLVSRVANKFASFEHVSVEEGI